MKPFSVLSFFCTFAFILLLLGSKAQAQNFLWQITSPQGVKSFIIGSVHVANSDLYPLSAPIDEALAQADVLVVETLEASPSEMESFILAKGRDARPLNERLTPTTKELLLQSRLDFKPLEHQATWLAALSLQLELMRQNGFESQYGLDAYFLSQAKAKELEVVALESLSDQLGPLSEMDDVEADLFLRSVLLEADNLAADMDKLLSTWKQGDTSEFQDIFFQQYNKYPELIPLLDKLIFARNKTMAARLRPLLSEAKSYFVVVGAGHLVGKESILSILAKEGFQISQL